MTVSISLWMRGSTRWSSSSGASKTNSSWTCMIILVERLDPSIRFWIRIMATLMISAAVPWRGVLMAILSEACRMGAAGDWISGR